MLKKSRKLNLSWIENRQFFKEFSIFRSSGLTIYYRGSIGVANRVTVVVGKRASNSAVARNALKRKLYSLVEASDLLKIKKDIVIVVIRQVGTDVWQKTLEGFVKTFET